MNFTLCKNRCNYTNRNKQPRTPLFPSNPSKTALSLALHHHACLMNAPLALRPCKALGRSTSGIHARPLSKVRCCRPKNSGDYRRDCHTTIPRLHQPFQNRTIPRLAPHSWLPCQRELDCDKAISYYKLQHSAISSTLIFAQPYLSQD